MAMVCSIISGVAGSALVTVIARGISARPDSYLTLGATFFALCFVSMASRSCSEIALLNVTQGAVLRLRLDLSRKLLATPLKQLDELGKHRLLAILTKDVETFVQAFHLVPVSFSNAVLIVSCFAYLGWLSPQLLGILVVILVLGMTGFRVAEVGALRRLGQVREQVDTLYENFRNLVEGNKELKLNAERGDAFVTNVIEPDARRLQEMFVGAMAAYTGILNAGRILFYLTIGTLLFIIPIWLPQSPETLISMTLVLLFLVGPISDVMGAVPALRQAGISLKKIRQLDSELPEETGNVTRGPDPFVKCGPISLEMRGVVHRYHGGEEEEQFRLGPVDIQIASGEIVFVVGGNGSGKTSLAMLLLGLYEPESGEIRLNGKTVDSGNIDYYRKRFSAVFSDFHLFERLLMIDQPDLMERATRYLKALAMDTKVQVTEGRFSTLKLSTGQRKRLALVASYLEDRPIYLFDEWAADQDPAFKRIFYAELLPDLKARGKAVVIISHDDAYFKYADRILKVESGCVSELILDDVVVTA